MEAAGRNPTFINPSNHSMNAFLTDLLFGLRLLRRAPLFTAITIATLALGSGRMQRSTLSSTPSSSDPCLTTTPKEWSWCGRTPASWGFRAIRRHLPLLHWKAETAYSRHGGHTLRLRQPHRGRRAEQLIGGG